MPRIARAERLSAILERLDEVVTAIANLSIPRESQPVARPQLPLVELRELFATKMKERGISSSTIRQVMITLEQLERSPWPENTTR